jgi:hypothetical protein
MPRRGRFIRAISAEVAERRRSRDLPGGGYTHLSSTKEGSRRALLGADPHPRLVEQLSLETRVTAKTPPTFLMHTRDERQRPCRKFTHVPSRAQTRRRTERAPALRSMGRMALGCVKSTKRRESPKACAAWLLRALTS